MTKPFNPADLQRAEAFFRRNMPGSLVDDGSVLPGGMKVRDDAQRIEYEERIMERHADLQQRNVHLMPSALFSNLLNVVFPSLEHFGPDHGRNTSQLACYIAEVEGVTDGTELEIVKAAGLLHDVGRTKPWQVSDKDAPRRSAELADRFIRSDANGARMPQVREAVCRLVAQYDPEGPPPRDPLVQALWDADHLEAARFAANTTQGKQIVDASFRALTTPFGRSDLTKKRWLRKHKWDLSQWGF